MSADLTTLLASAESGDRAAADALFAALYDELHRMARRELTKRGAGVTLGATTAIGPILATIPAVPVWVRRLTLVAAFAFGGAALTACVAGLYLPIFEMAGSISAYVD